MFSEIERVYKRSLVQSRFRSYYLPRAILTVLIALIVNFGFGVNRWLVYGVSTVVLLAFVAIFFVVDFYKTVKTMPEVHKTRGFFSKLQKYYEIDDKRRLDNLIKDLCEHDVNTKAELELAIDYYEHHRPLKAKPGLLEWTLSAVVALSSTTMIAYDEATNAVDLDKLFATIVPTFEVALLLLSPIILLKVIKLLIEKSRVKLDSGLVEDLAYIYMHYESFEKTLKTR